MHGQKGRPVSLKEMEAIDRVIKTTLKVMEESRYQIFEICEGARAEKEALEKELENVLEQIKETIDKVDQLELDFRRSRVRLSEVSRNFNRFSEHDIKKAYEVATNYQMELSVFREKESNLRYRREDLRKRIRNIERTIERAETVVMQMNVVYDYMSGDLSQVGRIVESARSRQLIGLKIILAQEEERKRIAREIHDGLAQSMAHLVLRTEIAERMLDQGQHENVKVEIKDLKGQLRNGLEEVRKIIFNLRPMALDDLGLVPTLRKYAQDFEEKHKTHTRFQLIGKEKRLSSALEVAIFRFVQESFSNIIKHANATHIDLRMTFEPKAVKIEIKDNGSGFDINQVEKKIKSGNHFGIVGMRERIEMLDGRLHLDSDPSWGTLVTMIVPFEQEVYHGKRDEND